MTNEDLTTLTDQQLVRRIDATNAATPIAESNRLIDEMYRRIGLPLPVKATKIFAWKKTARGV